MFVTVIKFTCYLFSINHISKVLNDWPLFLSHVVFMLWIYNNWIINYFNGEYVQLNESQYIQTRSRIIKATNEKFKLLQRWDPVCYSSGTRGSMCLVGLGPHRAAYHRYSSSIPACSSTTTLFPHQHPLHTTAVVSLLQLCLCCCFCSPYLPLTAISLGSSLTPRVPDCKLKRKGKEIMIGLGRFLYSCVLVTM